MNTRQNTLKDAGRHVSFEVHWASARSRVSPTRAPLLSLPSPRSRNEELHTFATPLSTLAH